MKKHSKRYDELMTSVKDRVLANEMDYIFTDEEIEFLAKEDLLDFAEKFPAEAEYYMEELS